MHPFWSFMIALYIIGIPVTFMLSLNTMHKKDPEALSKNRGCIGILALVLTLFWPLLYGWTALSWSMALFIKMLTDDKKQAPPEEPES